MLEFTIEETMDLEDMFGVDAEYYEDRENTYVVSYSSIDSDVSGRPPAAEAFLLGRGTNGRIFVDDGDGFDWSVYDAARKDN